MMPSSFPLGVPPSVTATVEWPVRFFSSRMSARVAVGSTLESLTTKPALYPLARATMAASSSMLWEP